MEQIVQVWIPRNVEEYVTVMEVAQGHPLIVKVEMLLNAEGLVFQDHVKPMELIVKVEILLNVEEHALQDLVRELEPIA